MEQYSYGDVSFEILLREQWSSEDSTRPCGRDSQSRNNGRMRQSHLTTADPYYPLGSPRSRAAARRMLEQRQSGVERREVILGCRDLAAPKATEWGEGQRRRDWPNRYSARGYNHCRGAEALGWV